MKWWRFNDQKQSQLAYSVGYATPTKWLQKAQAPSHFNHLPMSTSISIQWTAFQRPILRKKTKSTNPNRRTPFIHLFSMLSTLKHSHPPLRFNHHHLFPPPLKTHHNLLINHSKPPQSPPSYPPPLLAPFTMPLGSWRLFGANTRAPIYNRMHNNKKPSSGN